MKINHRPKLNYPSKNRGMTVIMLATGMAVILGIIGLAIDFGHAYLNKTRLQNLVDALALTGAKSLNDSRSTTQSLSAIETLFHLNINGAGSVELKSKLGFNDLSLQYSDSLEPFTPGGSNPRYVKVSVNSLQLQSWFLRALGTNSIPVSASAIAGPSTSLSSYQCDLTPLLVCGSTAENPAQNNGSSFWGYKPGMVQMLKATSKNKSSCIGPGNYHLISLSGTNGGANAIRAALAGNEQSCIDLSAGLLTKPGNTTGPSIQGLNTRFGEYSGPLSSSRNEYPPDAVTTETSTKIDDKKNTCQNGQSVDLDFNWQSYQQAVKSHNYNNPPPGGVIGRRVLKVVIGDCDSSRKSGGRTTIPYLGTGCFFMLKKAYKNEPVYGEFIKECMQDGSISNQPSAEHGPYKIILHALPGVT
ncbi:MAG: pilus assembly protein TadG-related protein [Thiolinea sp.]